MDSIQQSMLRITGYSDKFSARPGEEITFFVHSEQNESFQAAFLDQYGIDINS